MPLVNDRNTMRRIICGIVAIARQLGSVWYSFLKIVIKNDD
jgi:hypothetical protein